jgi:hypothetical protein
MGRPTIHHPFCLIANVLPDRDPAVARIESFLGIQRAYDADRGLDGYGRLNQ